MKSPNASPNAVSRRYAREFLGAMCVYALLLIAAIYALSRAEALWTRTLLALLPVLPVAFAARALVRFVRDSDELQRRIQLEAFALASLVLTLGSFALGLLGVAGVVAIAGAHALIMILPAYALLYGLAAAITGWRYR